MWLMLTVTVTKIATKADASFVTALERRFKGWFSSRVAEVVIRLAAIEFRHFDVSQIISSKLFCLLYCSMMSFCF